MTTEHPRRQTQLMLEVIIVVFLALGRKRKLSSKIEDMPVEVSSMYLRCGLQALRSDQMAKFVHSKQMILYTSGNYLVKS